MSYEQTELDLRLNYERDLKSNITTVADFTGQKMADDLEEAGRPLTEIRTKQEAYGVAAQQYVKVLGKHKTLKGGMDDFLKSLEGDGEIHQIAGVLYNASIELAQEAVIMAAHAKRIIKDLYYGITQSTPLEEYEDEMDYDEVDDDVDEESEE